ncbi:hypothetical protein D3C87_1974730 [compost metagenome]
MLGPVQRGKGSKGQRSTGEQHFFAQEQGEAGFALPGHKEKKYSACNEKAQTRREERRRPGVHADFNSQEGSAKDQTDERVSKHNHVSVPLCDGNVAVG